MMIRRPAPFVFLLVAGLFSARVVAQEARETERVARLIRDLGASSYLDRQRAGAELERLGTATRAQLEAAAADSDPEVRLRANELLRGIQIEELWRASTFTSSITNKPVSEVLPMIADQTGNRISTGSRYEVFGDGLVTLDFDRGNYWQALDELCRQSSNHLRPHYDVRERGIVLTAGRPGQNPVAYSGPLRVELVSARRVYDDELAYKNMELKRLHSFKLSFNVLWEDRFELTAYRATPRVQAAVTDTRHALLSVEANDAWHVAGPSTRQLSLELRLQPLSLDAQRLESLLLGWNLLAVGDRADLTIDDVRATPSGRSDGLEVVVESCQAKTESLWEVVLAVAYDELLPDPPESVFQENVYKLSDEQGNPWTLVDESHDLRGELVRSKLTFRRESDDSTSEPRTLAISYPRIRSRRELSIAFRHVPLPKPIGQ